MRIGVSKMHTGDGVGVLSGVNGAGAKVSLENVLGVVVGEKLGRHDYDCGVWVLKGRDLV